MVRKALAVAVSACCYAAGHTISRTLLRIDCLAFFYPLYNTLMFWSSDIETWAGIEFLWHNA